MTHTRTRSLRTRLVAAALAAATVVLPACARDTLADPPAVAGWKLDWSDGFDGPLSKGWGAYGWGNQAPTDGAMGLYKLDNVYAEDGHLVLRTWYRNGQWTSAGVSSAKTFVARDGRWEVRARFQRAEGIGYAFLLWPDDGRWPPEVDFAEGRVNGPKVMGAYHFGKPGNAERRFHDVPKMDEWHTYGVIVEEKQITYLLDGQPWSTVELTEPVGSGLWLGLQTGAMDPNGMAKDYETVRGGVPNKDTPAKSHVDIDWAAHYRRV